MHKSLSWEQDMSTNAIKYMISLDGEVVLSNCCIYGPESVSIYDDKKGIFLNDWI